MAEQRGVRMARQRRIAFGCVILLLMAAIAAGAAFNAMPRSAPNKEAAASAAHKLAPRFLGTVLKAPASAEYPRDTVQAIELDDFQKNGKTFKRWGVLGAVDAPNVFGVKIRGRWTMTLIFVEEARLLSERDLAAASNVFGERSAELSKLLLQGYVPVKVTLDDRVLFEAPITPPRQP